MKIKLILILFFQFIFFNSFIYSDEVEIISDNMIFVRNDLADLVTIGKEYQNDWKKLYKNSKNNPKCKHTDFGEWINLDN